MFFRSLLEVNKLFIFPWLSGAQKIPTIFVHFLNYPAITAITYCSVPSLKVIHPLYYYQSRADVAQQSRCWTSSNQQGFDSCCYLPGKSTASDIRERTEPKLLPGTRKIPLYTWAHLSLHNRKCTRLKGFILVCKLTSELP